MEELRETSHPFAKTTFEGHFSTQNFKFCYLSFVRVLWLFKKQILSLVEGPTKPFLQTENETALEYKIH